MRREKSAFDHINTDWNLPHDDGSTDFSDDDTVLDERVSTKFPLIKTHKFKINFNVVN
jgi:Arf-GAP/SH3 domain/ANK repeat/PH domain-containing protein